MNIILLHYNIIYATDVDLLRRPGRGRPRIRPWAGRRPTRVYLSAACPLCPPASPDSGRSRWGKSSRPTPPTTSHTWRPGPPWCLRWVTPCPTTQRAPVPFWCPMMVWPSWRICRRKPPTITMMEITQLDLTSLQSVRGLWNLLGPNNTTCYFPIIVLPSYVCL